MKITTLSNGLLLYFIVFQAYALSPSHGMVVTSQHHATDAGIEILNKGGNAIDAAVAVGYALSVVEPCCGNLGGGGFMLIHLNDNQNIFLNFREKAPIKANTALYLDKNGQPVTERMRMGYLPVAVPGTVMGLNTALKKYGTMSLAEVMSSAIKLASQGFVLVPGDVKFLKNSWAELKTQSNVALIFGKNGHSLQAGDRLIQADLANTLRYIARYGTAGFYQGRIAKQLVEASREHGGVLSLQDFSNYSVDIQKPLMCQYRGYDIISAPPPSSGGVVLCEILNITSAYPLSALGYHQPQAVHYILEAMRLAYADRNRYLGDPNFVNNPVEKLISKEYATRVRKLIQPWKAGRSTMVMNSLVSSHEKPQTTHYSIVDRYGNAVSVTYTLNGNFGSKVIAGDTGFFLNNEMDDFALTPNTPNEFGLIQGDKNKIEPQKRPLSSMTPTIVLKNQQLYMVLGAPGGSTIPTQVLETLENVIDYHMNIKQAVDAPRYHMQWLPDLVYIEADAFSEATRHVLRRMGYRFQMGSPYNTSKWGAVAAILVKYGQVTGAIDKRRPQGLARSQ